MGGIVISYRRADTRWITGRIFDRLKSRYGAESVFMDIDSIPLGKNFQDHLKEILDRSNVMLAIIGPQWTRSADGKNHLTEEGDWVRVEIESALARKIPVIPVLIDNTEMPPKSVLPESMRDFAFYQGTNLDTGLDFKNHMERLIRAVDTYVKDRRVKAGRKHRAQTKSPLPNETAVWQPPEDVPSKKPHAIELPKEAQIEEQQLTQLAPDLRTALPPSQQPKESSRHEPERIPMWDREREPQSELVLNKPVSEDDEASRPYEQSFSNGDTGEKEYAPALPFSTVTALTTDAVTSSDDDVSPEFQKATPTTDTNGFSTERDIGAFAIIFLGAIVLMLWLGASLQ